MSQTTYAAKLSVPGVGDFYFSTFLIKEGRINGVLQKRSEEISTPGVDGKRWRIMYKNFDNIEAQSVSDFADYKSAASEADRYDIAQGEFGTITLKINGMDDKKVSVKILEITSQVQRGALVGFGADPASSAVVFAQWTLCMTDIYQATNR